VRCPCSARGSVDAIFTWKVKPRWLTIWRMRRPPKPSPTELPLPFVYDDQQTEDDITALGGMPLLVQAFRSLGAGSSVERNVALKQRQRGLDEAGYVESFVILNAAGGDCLEDFEHLRADTGLAELIGHELPSAEAARKFLYQFHEDQKIEEAQQALALGQTSYIPEPTTALRGLAAVNREVVGEFGRRTKDRIATLDLDATIIESWKREAQPTYKGFTGYQPMLALWAEMNVIVADEFRDGNVGANSRLLPVAREAFAALPETVEERYFRGDSACYEQELMRWLRNPKRENGPEGHIGFGISASMSESLRERIRLLPEALWRPYREDGEATCECGEVLNWDPLERRAGEELDPIRYLAIRISRKQGELFADGHLYKYFAVVTNRWDSEAKRLLEWQREKAGSIEAAHEVLKNELAAGVMPCGRFGANAAWLRLAVLTYNVLSALKRLALPPELLSAKPKRLRFLIFHTAGRILHHARAVVCRLKQLGTPLGGWRTVLAALPVPRPG
jgi:DDE family transposase